MKVGNELETIPCIFHHKHTGYIKQGNLITDKNRVIEIHFMNNESFCFISLKELLKEFNIGMLPFEEKQLNKFQQLIKIIFKL